MIAGYIFVVLVQGTACVQAACIITRLLTSFVLPIPIETPYVSHFSIPQAVEFTNGLDPKPERAFVIGFCHSVDHYAEDEKLKALDGGKSETAFRVAYDGQKISF